MKFLLKALLLLVVLALGALAWDVWQLRALRPPPDRTFEGFLRAGRTPVVLRIDDAAGRLTWTPLPARTLVPQAGLPWYVFDRSGALVDWSPGTDEGMISGAPVRRIGREATLDAARSWLRGGQKPQ